jgi:AraC-like DNA-binding protein
MTLAEGTIPHTRFDTTLCPAEHRLAAFREAIGVLFDVGSTGSEDAEAPVTLDSWLFGSSVLCTGTGPGLSYHRTPRAIASDGRDLVMIQVYEAGRCLVAGGAPEAASEPGDLVVTDLACPITTRETAFRNINLCVPRSSIAPLLRDPNAHGGRVLRRDLPLVTLVRSHLRELARQAPMLPATQAMDVLQVTVELVAAALNGSVDARTEHGTHVALGARVRRFIEDHLDEDHLTPEALAGRFGLSRATMYRLFVTDGGVQRYMQRRRLSRARLDLLSPAQRGKTVAEIGATAGYTHAQDFIRAYRRAFGVRPAEEREEARRHRRSKLGRPSPRLPLWSDWVGSVR